MTNKQAKICKYILKYKSLDLILAKSHLSDEVELQGIFDNIGVDVSDETNIELTNDIINEYEDYCRKIFDLRITRTISIISLIISIIALLR